MLPPSTYLRVRTLEIPGNSLMKAFIFFTKRYLREYNFGWWFHVSPYLLLGDQQTVLDRTYTKQPLPVKAWTDNFMKNKVTCPEISQYSQYRNNQEKEYCYLRKVSMYYYQPSDIEAADNNGKPKEGWVDWELNQSLDEFNYPIRGEDRDRYDRRRDDDRDRDRDWDRDRHEQQERWERHDRHGIQHFIHRHILHHSSGYGYGDEYGSGYYN